MPLPPITPSGGGSGAPYVRDEDAWYWNDDILVEIGDLSTSGASSPRAEFARRKPAGGADDAPVSEDTEGALTELELQLVRGGQAYLQKGLPGRLKGAFSEAVTERYGAR